MAILNIVTIKNTHIVRQRSLRVDSIALQARQLKRLYLLSTASSKEVSYNYRQQFFKEFPNDFNQLLNLYGYDDKNSKPSILYDEAPNHILKLFNSLSDINDTLYYRKIIQVSIGGHWDADAVNYFQHGLRERVLDKTELTVYLLSHIPEDKIKSFWYFYFDGVHPEKQIPEQLLRIKSIDSKIYGLMIEARNEVIEHEKE